MCFSISIFQIDKLTAKKTKSFRENQSFSRLESSSREKSPCFQSDLDKFLKLPNFRFAVFNKGFLLRFRFLISLNVS